MGRRALVSLVLLAGTLGAHPRLFLTPDRLQAVRDAADHPHHKAALAALTNRVVRGVDAYKGRPGYALSAYAREAAFLFALTQNRAHADRAYRAIVAAREVEDQAHTGYGLSRAMMSMGFALAYDWAYQGWSSEQRETVLGALKRAADAWPEFSHPNVEAAHKGSNWVGVTRGGELLLHLAARNDGDYGARSERIALCIEDLRKHIATAYGKSGWTQEGLGYLEYTFGFLAPAVLASGDAALQEALRARPWARLAMNAISFRATHDRVQTGVDGERPSNEGFASLILALTPAKELPGLLWWYDRHAGYRALTPHFDGNRAGTVWALLFYPAAVRPTPPRVAPLIDPEKGVAFWRNAFDGPDDVLIAMTGSHDHHKNAWSQTETWQLSIIGFDATFALGAGKGRTANLYSKPLVDAKIEKQMGLGRQLASGHWEAARNFGVRQAERKFAVDTTPRGAAMRMEDHFAHDQPLEWLWQIRPGPDVTVRQPTLCSIVLQAPRGTLTVAMQPPCAVAADAPIQFRAPRATEAWFRMRLELSPAIPDTPRGRD
jgi:hypothetical protein